MKNNKYEMLTISIIAVWEPLYVYLLRGINGIGLIIFLVTFLCLIKQIKNEYFWKEIRSNPVFIWIIWCLYNIINTFLLHEPNLYIKKTTFIFFLILPVFIIIIFRLPTISLMDLIDLTINALFIFLIICILFDKVYPIGKDEVSRLGIIYNANSIAISAFLLIFIIGLKMIIKGHIFKKELLLAIISIYVIGITASRKTFLALVVFLLTNIIYFLFFGKKKLYRKIKYLMITFLIIVIFIFIITPIKERLFIGYKRTFEARNIDSMFDGRLVQYIRAGDLFKENPMIGVGLYNFGRESGLNITAHSEFIVQIVETGLLGSLLWSAFYINLIKQIKKIKLINGTYIRAYIMIFLLSIFILMTGTWVYNLPIYWMAIGIILKLTSLFNLQKKVFS